MAAGDLLSSTQQLRLSITSGTQRRVMVTAGMAAGWRAQRAVPRGWGLGWPGPSPSPNFAAAVSNAAADPQRWAACSCQSACTYPQAPVQSKQSSQSKRRKAPVQTKRELCEGKSSSCRRQQTPFKLPAVTTGACCLTQDMCWLARLEGLYCPEVSA